VFGITLIPNLPHLSCRLEAITMLDMEDLLAPMGDDPLMMALGAAGDDRALLRPGGSGMNFSLHGSGSGATTSDGSGRLSKRRRGHDADEVRRANCSLFVCVLCWHG
jgi:hypothetical protein